MRKVSEKVYEEGTSEVAEVCGRRRIGCSRGKVSASRGPWGVSGDALNEGIC